MYPVSTSESQMFLVFLLFPHLDTCNIDCVRKRMEQKLQTAIKSLRKSINKQQFYIQFSGTEYEVAQKAAKVVAEGNDPCNAGQVQQDGKCGENLAPISCVLPPCRLTKLPLPTYHCWWGLSSLLLHKVICGICNAVECTLSPEDQVQ